MLEEVYDSRRPHLIGRFQRWIERADCTVAFVKFPGQRPCQIAARYIRRVSTDRRKAAAVRRALVGNGMSLEEVERNIRIAARYGLTVYQYMDAVG